MDSALFASDGESYAHVRMCAKLGELVGEQNFLTVACGVRDENVGCAELSAFAEITKHTDNRRDAGSGAEKEQPRCHGVGEMEIARGGGKPNWQSGPSVGADVLRNHTAIDRTHRHSEGGIAAAHRRISKRITAPQVATIDG